MNTPEFNQIVTNKSLKKLQTRSREIKRYIEILVGVSLVGALSGLVIGRSDSEKRHNTVEDGVVCGAFSSAMIAFALLMNSLKIDADIDKEKTKNDKARNLFMSNIGADYDAKNFDAAKNLAEYILSYMDATDKQKIESEYKQLDLNDNKACAKFINLVRDSIEKVINDNQGMRSILQEIAAGKTYMFHGWNYGTTGHGGR